MYVGRGSNQAASDSWTRNNFPTASTLRLLERTRFTPYSHDLKFQKKEKEWERKEHVYKVFDNVCVNDCVQIEHCKLNRKVFNVLQFSQ